KLVINEVVGVHVAEEHDIATASAVAAIGPAPRLVFLPPEADAAASTITCGQLDCAFVDKHLVHDAEPAAFAKVRGARPARRGATAGWRSLRVAWASCP